MRFFKELAVCCLMFVMGTGCLLADADDSSSSTGPLVHFGLEGGFNVASLNSSNATDVYASRLGFVGGAFLIVPLGSNISFHPELLYEQKGGKINGNDYQADYFEVPVLLELRIVGPLSLLAGPAFNTVVSNTNITNINNRDTGLIGGAQVLLGPIVVTGRYEIGLNDIDSNQQVHNGTFTFMGGFCFI